MADMQGWTKDLEGTALPLAKAVLVAGCVLGPVSLVVLLIALLEFTGRYFRPRWCGDVAYLVAHFALATLWLPVIGISGYLVSKEHYPSIAFVASGAFFVAGHVAVALSQLCWCCCGGVFVGTPTDHPKSALLTPQSAPADQRRRDGGGPNANDAGDAGASGVSAVEGRNPFRATYGLLPGSSSVFAYHIFIPGEDQPEAVPCTYTGLQSGPPKQESRRKFKVQPLVTMQPTVPPQMPEQAPATPGLRESRG